MNTSLNYKRIVLKFGTNLLTAGGDHLDVVYVSSLVCQVARLIEQKHEIIIVSSGAVAAGRDKLNIGDGKRGVPMKQVLAAVGQSRLMKIYEELFAPFNIHVAQALLTRSDLTDRAGYLNARNTLLRLMEMGVVTIVNENDVVAIEELTVGRFGDNDHLSAMVANLVDADLLIILSDIDGFYSADPAIEPTACLIPEVISISSEIELMASGASSKCGTGGMITKIDAAKQATTAGITTIIASGREAEVIARIISGEKIGTRFLPSSVKRESRARWLLSGLRTAGRIYLDEGATQALMLNHKSLLSAGIVSVEGNFKRGDVLDIYDHHNIKIGSGLSNYDRADVNLIKGMRSSGIATLLTHDYGPEVIHRNNLVLFKGE